MKVTNEIKELIIRGKSLNNINKNTGIAKSTLYYHYKKIKGKKYKEIKINLDKKELGEFLGIFSGDGYFIKGKKGHYTIRISIGYYEKEYAIILKNKLSKWFNKQPSVYYSPPYEKPSVIILVFNSITIYQLIRNNLTWENKKTYSIKLKDLNLKDSDFNIGFLRGLIDTDGSYYAPKRRISFSTVSKNLAEQVIKIIEELIKIPPKVYIIKKEGRANLYTITLHGNNSKELIKIIEPSNPNKKCASWDLKS